jgi:inner membrane protein
MDSLTQFVLGAAVGEAVLGKKAGNKAILWGGIAGTIPDLDVFFTMGSALKEITLHRGFSHSLLFAFLAAPALGWLINKLYKDQIGFKGWTLLFFWSIITHPILDTFTTYGTQLFLPFSDYRAGINNIFIIDFVYTVPLMICIIACLFINRENKKRRKWNNFGLIFSSAYMLLSLVNKGYASNVFSNSLEEKGIKTEHCMTGVTPLNILLWYNVAEVDSGYYIGYYSLLDKDKNIDYSFLKRNEQLIEDIKDTYEVNRLKWFSNNYYAIEKVGDEIHFATLKFGTNGNQSDTSFSKALPFYFIIKKQTDGSLLLENNRGEEDIDIKEALGQLYRRVLGNKNAFKE